MNPVCKDTKIFKNSSDIEETSFKNFRIKDIFKGLSSKADKHPFHAQRTPTQLRIHQFEFHDTTTFYYRHFL